MTSKTNDWAAGLKAEIDGLDSEKNSEETRKAWFDAGAGRQRTIGLIAQLDSFRQRLTQLQ